MSSPFEPGDSRRALSEARILQGEGFERSGLDPETSHGNKLAETVSDPRTWSALVPWELGGNKPDERALAAKSFFGAAKLYERVVHDPRAALKWYALAWETARWSPGEEFRDLEIRSVHRCLDIWRLLAELSSKDMEKFFGDDIPRQTANEMIGRFAEYEGYLNQKYLRTGDAAQRYSEASFRFERARRYEESVRASERHLEAARLLADRGEIRSAAEYMIDAARKSVQANLSDGSALAGRLFQGAKAMGEAQENFKGAEVALEAAAVASASENWLRSDANFRLLVLALADAEKVFQTSGDPARADAAHFLRNECTRLRLRLQKHRLSSAFLLLMKLVWGYGTRAWNLARISTATLLAFTFVYFVLERGRAVARTADLLRWAVSLSAYSFIPGSAVAEFAGYHLSPLVQPTRAGTRVAAGIENLIGAAIFAMAGFLLSRWFKRQVLPGDH